MAPNKPDPKMKLTRNRSKLPGAPRLMRGLDERGMPMDPLPQDPEDVPFEKVVERLALRPGSGFLPRPPSQPKAKRAGWGKREQKKQQPQQQRQQRPNRSNSSASTIRSTYPAAPAAPRAKPSNNRGQHNKSQAQPAQPARRAQPAQPAQPTTKRGIAGTVMHALQAIVPRRTVITSPPTNQNTVVNKASGSGRGQRRRRSSSEESDDPVAYTTDSDEQTRPNTPERVARAGFGGSQSTYLGNSSQGGHEAALFQRGDRIIFDQNRSSNGIKFEQSDDEERSLDEEDYHG